MSAPTPRDRRKQAACPLGRIGPRTGGKVLGGEQPASRWSSRRPPGLSAALAHLALACPAAPTRQARQAVRRLGLLPQSLWPRPPCNSEASRACKVSEPTVRETTRRWPPGPFFTLHMLALLPGPAPPSAQVTRSPSGQDYDVGCTSGRQTARMKPTILTSCRNIEHRALAVRAVGRIDAAAECRSALWMVATCGRGPGRHTNTELPFNEVNAVMSRLPIGVVNLLRGQPVPRGPSLREAYRPFNAVAALAVMGMTLLAWWATRTRRALWPCRCC